jgi:hypothetical protein
MGERRGTYRVLVGKYEGKRPVGRPGLRWEDNIEIDFHEMGWSMDQIRLKLAQDRDGWWVSVNAVMNLLFSQNAGNFLTT